MAVSIQILSGEITAFLSGEIDHHNAKELREQIDTACQSNRPDKLLLDFGQVVFMDSSGIGLIMGRYRLMQDLGGSLEVVSVPQALRKVMQIAGLEKLGIFKSVKNVKNVMNVKNVKSGGKKNESN